MEKSNTQMDTSAASWLSELQEIDEDYNFFPDVDFDLVDEEDFLSHELIASEDLQGKSALQDQSLFVECKSKELSNSCTDEITSFEEMLGSINDETFSPKLSSSSSILSLRSQILSFDNSDSLSSSPPNNTTEFYELKNTLNQRQDSVETPNNNNKKSDSLNTQNVEAKSTSTLGKRSPSHAHDHIIAERKRREKISQSFIALAALVPGLKKMDKASVLGDSIRYVKELKERLAVLEEESKKTKAKKAEQLHGHGAAVFSSLCEEETIDGSLPQVEAREWGQQVLLRIHCWKEEGILVRILSEIQSLQLMLLNSSVLSFGDSILDITIIVQAGEGYNLTLKELVKNLRTATLKLMS
ncbi:transcription factor bHLH25-like isoform X1 [Arachis stenosperma]|uniref:transcription factor bHLH25-like isoform X1 n=1 Tax=Arachis stenosperma TaxID=217475 RepID=UPI0025ABB449|nr:transcription factor bHLH25-like isoform X1 [Arachis stenosperma]